MVNQMLSREELNELANFDDSKLTNEEYGGKISVISRGLPYYGKLKKEFPAHWSSFTGMHKRHKVKGVDIDSLFDRDVNGFIEFILYVGDIPKFMIDPSIGRIDHSKGYIVGNFRWESLSSNAKESSERNKDKMLKLSIERNFENRKIPNNIVKIIKDAKIGKLKNVSNGKFVSDCVEWLKNRFSIIVSKRTIYSILNGECYRDVT